MQSRHHDWLYGRVCTSVCYAIFVDPRTFKSIESQPRLTSDTLFEFLIPLCRIMMADLRIDTLICSKSLGHTVYSTSIDKNALWTPMQYHTYLINFPDTTSLTTSHEQDGLERDRQCSVADASID